MADINHSETHCGPCLKIGERKKAAVHCEVCDEFQCHACVRVHNQYAFMAGHTFKNLISPMSLVRAQSKDLLTCEVHNRPYEMFCNDHQSLCCSKCAVESHRACKHIQEIGRLIQTINLSPFAIIKRVKKTKGRVCQALKNVQSVCDALQAKLVNISVFLNSLKNKTPLNISTCQDAKTNKLQELENLQLSKEKHLTDICQNVYGMVSMYKSVIYRQNLEKSFVQLNAIRPKLAEMVDETNELLSDFQQIDVAVSLHTRYVDFINKTQVANSMLTKTALRGCANKSEFIPLQCYKTTNKPIKLKNDFKKTLHKKIDFLREGRLVLTEYWNNLVLVLSDNMEEIASLKTKQPLDIATINECTIVLSVSDSPTINVLDIDNSDKIVSSRSLKGNFNESFYNSICKYNDDTVVVGPLLVDRVAHLFNFVNGQECKFQKDLPKKKWSWTEETATVAFIKNRNLLVVAERRKNLIYICDLSNDTADHIRVTDERIQDPRGMAVASNHCVFVCCYKSHKIVQISPNGHVLCALQLQGLFFPTDVCFSSDGKKMFILSSDSDKVFVCELGS